MNKVILMGRLTKDPELKITPNGNNVCSFCVACDRRYTQDGERKADFINCVAWRQCAEFIVKYFRKGNRIAVDGSLSVRSYDDDSGNRRYITEVVAEHAEFCEKKSVENSGTHGASNETERFDSFEEYDDFPF